MKDIMAQAGMQEKNNKTSQKCFTSGRHGIPTVRRFR
jgi:hypothetical protein